MTKAELIEKMAKDAKETKPLRVSKLSWLNYWSI